MVEAGIPARAGLALSVPVCPGGDEAGDQRVGIHSWLMWELVHREKARHKLNLQIQGDDELIQPHTGGSCHPA